MRRAGAILALIATLVLSGAGNCDPREYGPSTVPGEEPDDRVTILQIWTYEPEPLQIRLSVHNAEGIALVGDKGIPLDNYVTTVGTSLDDVKPGQAAIWEFPMFHPNAINGSVKIDVAKGVKGGCKLFDGKGGVKVNLGQDQTWQGPRATCLFARS